MDSSTLTVHLPQTHLKQKIFRLGRSKISDDVIRESDKGASKWLNAVSKCQYKIIMNITGVFLREKSFNGIWLNSIKVGEDNMWPLEHNSEICFLCLNKKVFVFILMEATSDSFPLKLTTKYTVIKVLGKGA